MTNQSSTNRTRQGSPTLWSTYHEIKAVLDAPAVEKRNIRVIYDDSRRVVDMTEIFPNLFIGDELIFETLSRAFL